MLYLSEMPAFEYALRHVFVGLVSRKKGGGFLINFCPALNLLNI
jgi:hypothetical protein